MALKRRREEYYERLSAVRSEGDWEGWTEFFLECVIESAEDGVMTASGLFSLLTKDRSRLLAQDGARIYALRLLELLPDHPIITLARTIKILNTSKPTALKAIETLRQAKVLVETSGKQRDRVYAYQRYLTLLMGSEE